MVNGRRKIDAACEGLVISRDQNFAVRLPGKERLTAVSSLFTWADCVRCEAHGIPGRGNGCEVGRHTGTRACSRDLRGDGRAVYWALAPDGLN